MLVTMCVSHQHEHKLGVIQALNTESTYHRIRIIETIRTIRDGEFESSKIPVHLSVHLGVEVRMSCSVTPQSNNHCVCELGISQSTATKRKSGAKAQLRAVTITGNSRAQTGDWRGILRFARVCSSVEKSQLK